MRIIPIIENLLRTANRKIGMGMGLGLFFTVKTNHQQIFAYAPRYPVCRGNHQSRRRFS